MIARFTKVIGLALTVACWLWARDIEHNQLWSLVLIWGAPLLQYPITMLGRQWLDARPDTRRVEWSNIFVHYAMMMALGSAIFPAIRSVQRQPGALPIPQPFGQGLVREDRGRTTRVFRYRRVQTSCRDHSRGSQ